MEKNGARIEEVRNLKIDQEIQSVLLCEVIEQKKKAIEDKVMIEDDKRVLTIRLEDKLSEVNMIYHMQLEKLNQVMIANHEINRKDTEIKTLKLQNEELRNDMKRGKELAKSFNKPNESIK